MEIDIKKLINAEFHRPCSRFGLEFEQVREVKEFFITDNIGVIVDPESQEFVYSKPLFRGLNWYCCKEAVNHFKSRENKLKPNYGNPPPSEFLPSSTSGYYLEIVKIGKQMDQENFSDYVPFCRTVIFGDYTFYYRSANPEENEYPVRIEIDKWPLKHALVG